MTPLVKPKPSSTWAVGVEVGQGVFFLTLRLTRISLTTFQDNGGGSRLSPLSGCRRRFGPHAICVSGLDVHLPRFPFRIDLRSDMPPNCRYRFPSHLFINIVLDR